VVIPTNFKDLQGWAVCFDRFILVVKQTDLMHMVPVGRSVGIAPLVRENAASDAINSLWLVNDHVNLDSYWTVYLVTMPDSTCAGGT